VTSGGPHIRTRARVRESRAAPKPGIGEALRTVARADKRVTRGRRAGSSSAALQTYLVKTYIPNPRVDAGRELRGRRVREERRQAGARRRDAWSFLGPGGCAAARRRIDEAVYMAGLGGRHPWALPGMPAADEPSRCSIRARSDRCPRDVAANSWPMARGRWRRCPVCRPSSMELFFGRNDSASRIRGARGGRKLDARLATPLLLASGERMRSGNSWDERSRRLRPRCDGHRATRGGGKAVDLTRAVVPPMRDSSGDSSVPHELGGFLAPIESNASGRELV
jgi:hypothetical protein